MEASVGAQAMAREPVEIMFGAACADADVLLGEHHHIRFAVRIEFEHAHRAFLIDGNVHFRQGGNGFDKLCC